MKLYIEKTIDTKMTNGDSSSIQYNAEIEGDAADIAKTLHMLGIDEHSNVKTEVQ